MIFFIPCKPSEPAKCPSCGKPESIIEHCAHCGHEYEQEKDGWKTAIMALSLIFGLVIVFGWLVLTTMDWLFMSDHHSLSIVMRGQWEWLKQIRF